MSLVKEINLWNVDEDTGEITPTASHRVYAGSELGDDWVVMYKKPLARLVDEGASYCALRIFLKLASMQDFNKDIVVSRAWLRKELNMGKNTFLEAIQWLSDKNYIKEGEFQGNHTFVLSPHATTCGSKNLKRRKAIWSITAEDLGRTKPQSPTSK